MNPLIIYQGLAATFSVLLIFSFGYFLGYRKQSRKFKLRSASDRDEMLTIERALKQFWDHEKRELENQKTELQRRIEFLEDRLDQYRRKAAGVGMMGLRRNRLSDMLITLLIENETLEEKLFLQNLKLKQERDEFLHNELRQISYKRVLLSELINQREVRDEMERLVKDKARWKRLDLKTKEVGAIDPAADGEEDEEEDEILETPVG